MSEKFCGSCGGVRIGENKFCIICGSKFATEVVRKCPTCNQDWPDAPAVINESSHSLPEPAVAAPVTPSVPPPNSVQSPVLSDAESHLEASLSNLLRPIKWGENFAKGKDCLNCGCPDSGSVCTVCQFVR